MKNPWARVVLDGFLIGLLVFLARYIPTLIKYPSGFQFINGLAVHYALTIFFGTIGFWVSGSFCPDRRRWHLPRVLGVVWLSGLVAVVPNSSHYLYVAFIFWLLSIIPLGLSMLFGGALSYWFVKEPADSPMTPPPRTIDRSKDQFSEGESGGRVFTFENLLIGVCAESLLVLITSTIHEVVQDRSINSNDPIGSALFFDVFVFLFFFILPLYSFRSTSRHGLDNKNRFAFNRVIAALTIASTAALLNILIALNVFSPALGMVVGPLLVPVVIIVAVMGLSNVLFVFFNHLRTGQRSG